MRLFFNKLVLILSVTSLTACSSIQSENKNYIDTSAVNSEFSALPFAAPLQISYQEEVKLLRINQLITETNTNADKIDDKQRAVLFYERGLIHERIGLSAHSRYDFTQSINLDPTFADAYSSLGVYLLMTGSYDEAFQAFDSAIELSENSEYSYLHRAVGLNLADRLDLAHQDIEHFYSLNKADPFRVLWRYKINYKVDKELAVEQLKIPKPSNAEPHFVWNIIDVMNNKTSEKAFFDNIRLGIKTNDELARRLCEAYYYLAHWHINNGDLKKGVYYLKLSIAANVKDFIEYKYALIDLDITKKALQLQLVKNNTKK